MDDMKIVLSFLWAATMLVYLLGDVVRIFAGDFKSGKIEGKEVSPHMWLGISAIMVIPILMIVLTILLDFLIGKWINIIVAIFFLLFNLAGIKGYKSYDVFLLIVSFLFNILVIWGAIIWV